MDQPLYIGPNVLPSRLSSVCTNFLLVGTLSREGQGIGSVTGLITIDGGALEIA